MKKIFIIVLVLLGWYACSDESEVPQISGIETTTFTDSRDGNTYQCIVVNGKTWMAENLRYRLPLGSLEGCYTFGENEIDTSNIAVSGAIFSKHVKAALESGQLIDPTSSVLTSLSYIENGMFTVDQVIGFYVDIPELVEGLNAIKSLCVEETILAVIQKNFEETELKNDEYSRKFGYLYTYTAALKALPERWRLPTDEDWKELEQILGMSNGEVNKDEQWRGDFEGLLLKEGEKGIGFNVRMGGGKLYGTFPYKGQYDYLNSNAYFWTDTKKIMNDSISLAYIRKLNYIEDRVFRGTSSLVGTAYSVRAIKK